MRIPVFDKSCLEMPPKFAFQKNDKNERLSSQILASTVIPAEICSQIRENCELLQSTIFTGDVTSKLQSYSNLIQLTTPGLQYPSETFIEKSIINVSFTEFASGNNEIIELAAQLLENLSYSPNLIQVFNSDNKFYQKLILNLTRDIAVNHSLEILTNLSNTNSGAFILLQEETIPIFNQIIQSSQNPELINSILHIVSNIFAVNSRFPDKYFYDGIQFFTQFFSPSIPNYLSYALIGLSNIARANESYKQTILEKIDINMIFSQLASPEPYAFLLLLISLMSNELAAAFPIEIIPPLIEREDTRELAISLYSEIFEANPVAAQNAVSLGIINQLLEISQIPKYENIASICIINAVRVYPQGILPTLFETDFINSVLDLLEYDDKLVTMQVIFLINILLGIQDENRQNILEMLADHNVIDLLERWNDDKDIGPLSNQLVSDLNSALS